MQDMRIISQIAKDTRVSSSQIIRNATKTVVQQHVKRAGGAKRPKRNPLLDLMGIDTGPPDNLSLTVDDIYDGKR